MTKVKLEQIGCVDLRKAVDQARDNAWKDYSSYSPRLTRIAWPNEWFNDGTTTASISGSAKCGGCGGKCEKNVAVYINFQESRVVYAETYPDYEETRVRVFNSGGKRSLSIDVSGQPCPKK